MDTILETINMEDVRKLQEYFPHGYHKTDKTGLPIGIQRMGMLHFDEILQFMDEKTFSHDFIYNQEMSLKLRFPACSDVAGRHI